MTDKELDGVIKRINELYHKSKESGLTEEEKQEQAELRKRYIANFRANFREQLNNIDVEQADGTIVSLSEAYGKKKN